jgi:hypothetical protein
LAFFHSINPDEMSGAILSGMMLTLFRGSSPVCDTGSVSPTGQDTGLMIEVLPPDEIR